MFEGNGEETPDALDNAVETTETNVAPVETEASEIEKLRAERDAAIDRLARLQAEFDNARKRALREQQDFRDFALADAMRTLLPILDSFDRAIAHAGEGTGEELRTGVELINRQLHDALTKLGLEAVPATGEAFDPNVHEALGIVETDEVPDHHVYEELQRGYRLKGRLLRPSMVRVAKSTK